MHFIPSSLDTYLWISRVNAISYKYDKVPFKDVSGNFSIDGRQRIIKEIDICILVNSPGKCKLKNYVLIPSKNQLNHFPKFWNSDGICIEKSIYCSNHFKINLLATFFSRRVKANYETVFVMWFSLALSIIFCMNLIYITFCHGIK